MSLELPASVERELERYALERKITPTQAALSFIRSGLQASRMSAERPLSEQEIEELRQNVPFFAFLDALPDEVIDEMERSSQELRSERFIPRG